MLRQTGPTRICSALSLSRHGPSAHLSVCDTLCVVPAPTSATRAASPEQWVWNAPLLLPGASLTRRRSTLGGPAVRLRPAYPPSHSTVYDGKLQAVLRVRFRFRLRFLLLPALHSTARAPAVNCAGGAGQWYGSALQPAPPSIQTAAGRCCRAR